MLGDAVVADTGSVFAGTLAGTGAAATVDVAWGVAVDGLKSVAAGMSRGDGAAAGEAEAEGSSGLSVGGVMTATMRDSC